MKPFNFHVSEYVDGQSISGGHMFRGGELVDAFKTASRLRRFQDSKMVLTCMGTGQYYQQACYKGRWRKMNVTL